MRLRRAVAEDAPSLLAVKQALRLPRDGQPDRGGFLLGTTLEGYRRFIARDWVLVAEQRGTVVGFAVVLAQATFEASEAWRKKDTVRLEVPAHTSGTQLAYFEQLAFLPRSEARSYAKYVAFLSAKEALVQHDGIVATVVREPFHNRAVLPFLEVTGFERVGQVAEDYSVVGPILSDVYYLSRETFARRLETPAFRRFLPRAEAQLR